MNREDKKLWVLYLKRRDNSGKATLYAWTLDKSWIKRFLSERDHKAFIKKKYIMDAYDAASFMTDHSDKKLIEDVLYDGKHTIIILTTIDESNDLSMFTDQLIGDTEKIYYELDSVTGLSDKERKVLKKIATNGANGNINTVDIFIHLFGHTFHRKYQSSIYDSS